MRTFSILIFLGLLSRSAPGGSYWTGVVGWGDNTTGSATGILTANAPAGSNEATNFVSINDHALSNVTAVAAGLGQSLALESGGRVVRWGSDFSFERLNGRRAEPGLVMIQGTILEDVIAISSGRTHNLALKRNGSVVAWDGDNAQGQITVPPGLSNVIAISAGGDQSLALKRDGTLVKWGEGNPPPKGLSNVVAVAAGRNTWAHDMALKSDGSIVEWNLSGTPANFSQPEGLGRVVAIASGTGHILALREDGTVFGWGGNRVGQATGVPTVKDPSEPYSTVGSLVTIGGQVLTNVMAIAAGNEYSLALKKNGTVVVWGHPSGIKLTVPPGLTNVVAIAAGDNFCLAITTDNNVTNLTGAQQPPK